MSFGLNWTAPTFGPSASSSSTPESAYKDKKEKIDINLLNEQQIQDLLKSLDSDAEFCTESDSSDDQDEDTEEDSETTLCTESQEVGEVPQDVGVSSSRISDLQSSSVAPSADCPPQPHSWQVDKPSRSVIPFSGRQELKSIPGEQTPMAYFHLLADDEFYNLIISQSNIFSREIFLRTYQSKARITAWKDLERPELEVWLGLYLHMGIIQIPRVNLYWNQSELFSIPVFRKSMSRDRFQGIMKYLHFAQNPGEKDPAPTDRLYKIRPLLDFFNKKMKAIFSPGKELSLDESMVLWRGRLKFRQYIKDKKHNYGIKLYKLTTTDGIVLRIFVYAGTGDEILGGKGHTQKVVTSFMEDFMGKGHAVYINNCYNSVDLARTLLEGDTYVSGILAAKRIGNPSEVVRKKLKKGESFHLWSDDGICVLKWKDKRDVLFLSTEHGPKIVEVERSRHTISKPNAIVQYNRFISGIDRQDKLMAYCNAEHKSLKWYKKLGLHIIKMMLSNAFLLHKKFSYEKNMDLLQFRLEIIKELLKSDSTLSVPNNPKTIHLPSWLDYSGEGPSRRRLAKRCKVCYSKGKRSQVTTCCKACSESPGFCLEPCFEEFHKLNNLL